MASRPVNPATARQRFEAVALPHLDAIYSAALRLAGNPDDAKDLLQDTILRAYRFFDQFLPDTNCRAWLLTILYNNFRNHLRRCSLHPVMPIGVDTQEKAEARLMLDANSYNPEEIIAQRWMGRQLEAAINALPLEFREPLLLVDIHDLSYPEVANVLNIPLGTVKSRVSRARSLLRTTLRSTIYPRGKTGT
ncbi:MAG TPA: sigma-70 family RNA polymerase sigma factor [Candidatus Binataceae bacterium]|nr:sigma-70 family RNA polymerase sigma factor [Candidatus Binataceae bacterium]